jgi:hypothetical protein
LSIGPDLDYRIVGNVGKHPVLLHMSEGEWGWEYPVFTIRLWTEFGGSPAELCLMIEEGCVVVAWQTATKFCLNEFPLEAPDWSERLRVLLASYGIECGQIE